jgi:hypothetical protein
MLASRLKWPLIAGSRTSCTITFRHVSASSLALFFAQAASAQFCMEGPFPLQIGSASRSVTSADLDGDGDVDLATADEASNTISVLRNNGDATFAPAIQVVTIMQPQAVIAVDVDADGAIDLVVAHPILGGGELVVFRNLGGASFGAGIPYPIGFGPYGLSSADLDGDGDVDLVVACYLSNSIFTFANQGNGTFTSLGQFPCGALPTALATADLDGDGDVDVVTVSNQAATTVRVLMNSGNGTFPTVVGYSSMWSGGLEGVVCADLDSDGDSDLAVSGPGWVTVFRNQGNGTLAMPMGTQSGGDPRGLAAADLDGDGDIDLVCEGAALLSNLGDGTFAPPQHFSLFPFPVSITTADLDGDGDFDVVAANFTTNTVTMLRNCGTSGVSFCAGDGSGTSCPCGNNSSPGSGAGCLNSLGSGGELSATGSATLAHDELVLMGSQMPNWVALFFQGTIAVNAGAGAVFGDGLRCAGGTVIRLAATTAAMYPTTGAASVSVRGGVMTAGTRVYQVLYRNVAAFCTPDTFNLTNGLRVSWRL